MRERGRRIGRERTAVAAKQHLVYNRALPSGSNSVVECDLAKVEVAGSNPVSRSRYSTPALVTRPVILKLAARRHRGQGVGAVQNLLKQRIVVQRT